MTTLLGLFLCASAFALDNTCEITHSYSAKPADTTYQSIITRTLSDCIAIALPSDGIGFDFSNGVETFMIRYTVAGGESIQIGKYKISPSDGEAFSRSIPQNRYLNH